MVQHTSEHKDNISKLFNSLPTTPIISKPKTLSDVYQIIDAPLSVGTYQVTLLDTITAHEVTRQQQQQAILLATIRYEKQLIQAIIRPKTDINSLTFIPFTQHVIHVKQIDGFNIAFIKL